MAYVVYAAKKYVVIVRGDVAGCVNWDVVAVAVSELNMTLNVVTGFCEMKVDQISVV